MLRKALLTERRTGKPLACLAAAAFLASTSPVRAEPSNANTAGAAPVAAAQPSPSPAPAAPPKDDGTTLRTVGYIAGGVGIVGFIVFAVAGIGAKNAHDRLEDTLQACGPKAIDCNDAFGPAADGKRLQTIANIGLATGLAGVGLGATLIMLGGHAANDTPAVATAPQGGMITFVGRF